MNETKNDYVNLTCYTIYNMYMYGEKLPLAIMRGKILWRLREMFNFPFPWDIASLFMALLFVVTAQFLRI